MQEATEMERPNKTTVQGASHKRSRSYESKHPLSIKKYHLKQKRVEPKEVQCSDLILRDLTSSNGLGEMTT